MPRHEAPNHPDCHVDCPDGGYAHYIEPYGPCVAGCNSGELSEKFADAIKRHGWSTRSSGIVRDISGRQLGDLARRVRAVAGGNSAAKDLLDDLEKIGAARGDDVVDATWTDADGVDVLKTLRDAAAGSILFS